MALSIKDPATDRVAREVAALTGETMTEAIRTALEERLARLRRRRSAATLAFLDGVVERGRARPILDARPEDELLGYDEHGGFA